MTIYENNLPILDTTSHEDDVDAGLRAGVFSQSKMLQRAIYHHATHPEEYPPKMSITESEINPKYPMARYSTMAFQSYMWEPDIMVALPPERWEYEFDNECCTIEKDGQAGVDALLKKYEDAFDAWAERYWPNGVPARFQIFRDTHNADEARKILAENDRQRRKDSN